MNEKRRTCLVLIALLEQVKHEGVRTLLPDRIIENVMLVAEHPVPEQSLSGAALWRFFRKATGKELYDLATEYHAKGLTTLLNACKAEQETRTPQQ